MEFELHEGEAIPLYVDESFAPEQAELVTASVQQVWAHEPVHRAFAAAAMGDDRDLKCTIAGSIAGVATGGLLIAGCFLITKRPKCGKLAAVGVNAGCYIADKCNGAQN
ncbi:hypothetical protein [Nannocystis radixulma]|uniref:Uncharacterized protein n=1 Tax=Nannocystis radixulma TaxID=2995305 RepID=A0ABT5BB33_9BACT|nr:hypothetical protein [Nannocystis radixulma]MDC0670658.1 hypothetical protein [Nannocystis radixulma]